MSEDSVEQARRRRRRLLRRGMENLGNPSRFPIPTPREEKASAEEKPRAVSQKAPEAPEASAEETQLVAAIEKRFRDLQEGKDYFVLLGVNRDSNREAVKAAFLQLAKVFHPDRLPPRLQHLSEKITAVFEAIREAYETLLTEPKRSAYLKTLEAAANASQRASGPTTEAEAEEAFKKGESLFRKKDYPAAEREYERAHGFVHKPLYLAAAAWAIYMDPERRSQAARAKQMILDAAKADPSCARAQYQLGVIARVEGNNDKAQKHFRQALEADPKHSEAQQELRLIEMRKKKGFSLRSK